MQKKSIIYCAANLVSLASAPLTLALVLSDARWHYIEIINQEVEPGDEDIRSYVMPKLMRVPGTRFIRGADLALDLAEFFRQLGKTDAVEFRFLRGNAQTVTEPLAKALAAAFIRTPATFVDVDVAQADFDSFQRHCGGVDRVRRHALTDAIGAALCDLNSPEPTKFHLASIHHLELLLGSKNATSFRAWARSRERERALAAEESQDQDRAAA